MAACRAALWSKIVARFLLLERELAVDLVETMTEMTAGAGYAKCGESNTRRGAAKMVVVESRLAGKDEEEKCDRVDLVEPVEAKSGVVPTSN